MTHYDGMAEAELRGEIMRLEVSLEAAQQRVAELENTRRFAVETACGLLKPNHRVECRCDECIGWLQGRVLQLAAEIERLRWELQTHRDKARGDYWAWQGDGEDHLESLVCPVLIQPQQLIQILQAAEAGKGE